MIKVLTALGVFLVLVSLSSSAFAVQASDACTPQPFPTTPVPPVASRDVLSFSKLMRVDVWRQSCGDATGPAIFLRVTPIDAAPSFCDFNLRLLQGTSTFNGPSAQSAGEHFCGNLLVATTFRLILSSFVPIAGPGVEQGADFDPGADFTLFFDLGGSLFPLDISSDAGPPAAGPPSVIVHPLGCTTCKPGDTLGFELHVSNPGGPRVVELKIGARLPDGSVVPILGRHEEELIEPGVTVTPLFSGFVLQEGGFLPGAYAVEAAILEIGLGETLGRHGVALTLGP